MAAIGFVLARRGEQWALEETGAPVILRRKFKALQLSKPDGMDELRYFDSYGHSKRQRFRGGVAVAKDLPTVADNDNDTAEDEISIEDLPIAEDEPEERVKPRNRFTAKKRR